MNPSTLTIGNRQVGDGQPCFVLAEVASAHGGSADAALEMLEAAFKMGADGIKFQLFRSELLVVHRHPGRKDFDQIELTEKEWKKVLRDPDTREQLERCRESYVSELAMGIDGRATARILDLIRDMAGGAGMVGS